MRQRTPALAARAVASSWTLNCTARFQCLMTKNIYDSRKFEHAYSQSQHPIRSPRQRSFATTTAHRRNAPTSDSTTSAEQPPLNPRWLSDLKTRVGKCITFGLNSSQITSAAKILESLALSWRRLLAGSEGFLTAEDRAGLSRHRVVWGEMDTMGHVNNVMYTRYAESARVEWATKFGLRARDQQKRSEWLQLLSSKGNGLILRSIRTDYKFPMTWPDHISVYHKLRNSPSSGDPSSFILDVVILSHKYQRPAARCVEDIVIYDYMAARKTELKPWMRDEFEDTFRLQEEEKGACLEEARILEEKVRKLERESWDREGAVEDLGQAGR